MSDLDRVIEEARACRLCAPYFAHEPRPVLRAGPSAKLVIIGQAPGTRVQASGIPWNDPSGDRLRQWLEMDTETFYDENRIAIVPMGFCFPGLDKSGSDHPPRKECAPKWHPLILQNLRKRNLTLLVGSYAQKYYLGKAYRKTMTETVRAWQDYQPEFLPLPHPSWRNSGWLKKNRWFEEGLLPVLRKRIASLL